MIIISVPVLALSFLVGVVSLQLQPELPSIYWTLLIAIALMLVRFNKKWLCVLLFLSGFFWAYLFGWCYLQKVPDVGITARDIVINGKVVDLPVERQQLTQFLFKINRFELQDYNGPVPEYIRLNWYYPTEQIKPAEQWQLVVRLKPPNGFQNPGGFDYEAWLFQQGIHATGYVRKSPLNKLVETAPSGSYLDQLRSSIRHQINHSTTAELASLLNALAIGYRGDMAPQSWQMFINTGTNHLIAISGLHIGLVAGFAWLLLSQLARFKIMTRLLSRRRLLIISFIVAFIYAGLAGFTIPTQRALVMLAVVYLGLYLYRQVTVVQSLSIALLVVLIISPVSVLSVGFWLSFLAVAAISYVIAGRLPGRNKIMLWLWPQWVVILALLPLSFYFFQQSSMIALVANLIAIPVIGMLVLPVLLLGILFNLVNTATSSLMIQLSAQGLSYLLWLLNELSQFSYAVWHHTQPGIFALCLAMAGLLLAFSPYGFRGRWLFPFLLLPLLIPGTQALQEESLELHVLDVGQGLSVLATTSQHALLFDTGARFSDRFDVGEKVVLPLLRQLNITKLDKLVISNGDRDHIGGAKAVLQAMQVDSVLGRDIESLQHDHKSLCQRGQSWHWDGIDFEILHPQGQHYRKRNNYSCVLKITLQNTSVMIAADIEKRAEAELVEAYANQLQSEILLVPHHGSKTSSTKAFLDKVKPELAIYSSGYLNRYRFPRPEVVRRYSEIKARQLNTAQSGYIRLKIDTNGNISEPVSYRQQYRRYWHRRVNSSN